MIEQLMVLAALFLCMRVTWQAGQRVDLDAWTEYLVMEPNAYRLWDQLLLYLDRRPFSLVTLYSLSWGASLGMSYLLLMPTGLGLLMFIVGVLAVSVNFSIRSSLMYPLLALLVVTGSPFILIPLAATKDHALWIGTGAMLFRLGLDPLVLLCAGLGVLLFLFLRFFIEAEWPESGAPQFTPRYVFNTVLGRNPEIGRGLLFWNSAGVAVMVLFGLLTNWPLLLWGAVPVLLMGCFWEPQLWLPILIMLLGI